MYVGSCLFFVHDFRGFKSYMHACESFERIKIPFSKID
jgi:hypothetical protein